MKLKLNVYPVLPDLEEKIEEVMLRAVEGKARLVEIAYGQAGDAVKKRVLNCLNRKDIRKLYSRIEKTDKGWGRVYVHFRW